MRVLFALWELFWFELIWAYRHTLYHPFWPDDNDRLEQYWPCSDKAQFWPPMWVEE